LDLRLVRTLALQTEVRRLLGGERPREPMEMFVSKLAKRGLGGERPREPCDGGAAGERKG
jgi:hypothetical protein